jgi:hypothetical protein
VVVERAPSHDATASLICLRQREKSLNPTQLAGRLMPLIPAADHGCAIFGSDQAASSRSLLAAITSLLTCPTTVVPDSNSSRRLGRSSRSPVSPRRQNSTRIRRPRLESRRAGFVGVKIPSIVAARLRPSSAAWRSAKPPSLILLWFSLDPLLAHPWLSAKKTRPFSVIALPLHDDERARPRSCIARRVCPRSVANKRPSNSSANCLCLPHLQMHC